MEEPRKFFSRRLFLSDKSWVSSCLSKERRRALEIRSIMMVKLNHRKRNRPGIRFKSSLNGIRVRWWVKRIRSARKCPEENPVTDQGQKTKKKSRQKEPRIEILVIGVDDFADFAGFQPVDLRIDLLQLLGSCGPEIASAGHF